MTLLPCELLDVEEVARTLPEFEEYFGKIPPLDERRSLRLGDSAQLVFNCVPPRPNEPGSDRLWYEVVEVRAGPQYLGTRKSPPRIVAAGARVLFGPEHVAEVDRHEAAR